MLSPQIFAAARARGLKLLSQAGPGSAVVSEFSSASIDGTDVFTDPRITWAPQ